MHVDEDKQVGQLITNELSNTKHERVVTVDIKNENCKVTQPTHSQSQHRPAQLPPHLHALSCPITGNGAGTGAGGCIPVADDGSRCTGADEAFCATD